MLMKKILLAVICILIFFLATACYIENDLLASNVESSEITGNLVTEITYTELETTIHSISTTIHTSLVEIPMIMQNPELPTGCEATAVAMLLQGYGYNVTKEEVARAIPTCKMETFNGKRYTSHPEEAFYGNPFSKSGYGIFSPAMVKVAQSFATNHTVIDLKGSSEAEIIALIDKNIPVCIWSTSGGVDVVRRNSWYIKNGDIYTDELFWWPVNQHCLVLTGYDETTVTVNDPQKGIWKYNREDFFKHYDDIGRYALYIQ